MLLTIVTPMLKTLIVDDEALARRGLKHRLAAAKDLTVVAEARNGREALQAIAEHEPDLVFLDIQMPGLDGFDVLTRLSGKVPAIIFVTAYDQYAIKAFEANALDYLLKPIEPTRLQAALDKVRQHQDRQRALEHKRSLLKLVSDITGQPVESMRELTARKIDELQKKPAPKLVIRDGGHVTWVPQDEIEWIDAAGDYMCVHANGETHIMRETMKRLEKGLDPSILQRVHRSTIVNIHQICEMQSHINGEYFLTLKSGQKLKLSRSYKHKLKYIDR